MPRQLASQHDLWRNTKDHTDKLTAIVTVADDGGSSGRLRRARTTRRYLGKERHVVSV